MSYSECMICGEQFEEEKTLPYCEDCYEERQSHKYIIEITPPTWGEEYEYGYGLQKNYGDSHGSGGEVKSREELMDYINSMIESWEGYDGILQKEGDEVTESNLFFFCFNDDVTKQEVLGNQRIDEYF